MKISPQNLRTSLKSPIYKDWILWVFLVVETRIISSIFSDTSGNSFIENIGATVIQFPFFCYFYFLLMVNVRNQFRARQTPEGKAKTQASSLKRKEIRQAQKVAKLKPGYKRPLFPNFSSSTYMLACGHQILTKEVIYVSRGNLGKKVYCDICQAQRVVTKLWDGGTKK